MDIAFILAVALAAVVLDVISALVALLIYYRWRNAELLSGLSKFIRESAERQQQVERLEDEVLRLTTGKDK